MSDRPIDFYFDFSSPYGYLAAQRIETVAEAHGASVNWRPYLLGALFKLTGGSPLLEQPLKGDYAKRDIARTARRFDVPFTLPDPFPFSAVAVSRAYYWLADNDRAAAVTFARRAYHAIFSEGRDLSAPSTVCALVGETGGDARAAATALTDPVVKARLRAEVETTIARGIFGSPFFLIGDEPFWGVDRLPDVAAWLAEGGW